MVQYHQTYGFSYLSLTLRMFSDRCLDSFGRYPRLSCACVYIVEKFGSPRFLGNPLIALPCSQTPVALSLLTVSLDSSAPVLNTTKTTTQSEFRSSITWLYYSLFTLPASVSLHWQNSLPADG